MQPSVRTLYAFASEFGVTVDEVLFDSRPSRRTRRRPPLRVGAQPGPRGSPSSAPRAAGDHAELRRALGAADVLGRRGRRVPRGDLRAGRRFEPRRLVRAPQRPRIRLRPQRHASGRRRIRRVHPRGRATRSPSRRRRRTASSNEGAETVRAIWVVRGRRRGRPRRASSDVPRARPRNVRRRRRRRVKRERKDRRAARSSSASPASAAETSLNGSWPTGGRSPASAAAPTASTSGSRRRRRSGRRRSGCRRGPRDCADARLLYDLVAPRDRGRELRCQRAHAPEPLDATGAEGRAARRAGHRAEALPRAVRGVREGSARHAVLRGAGAAALRELLLRPGGHPLRGRRARRVHLVGAPPAHADRLGARQRDEHGRDARRLRGDLPGDRPAVPLPGLARAVGGRHRRHRRRPPRRPPGLGGDHAGRREPGAQHRQRRRLPLAPALAAARGRHSAWSRPLTTASRRRWRSRWPTPPNLAAIVRGTGCATST